MGYHVEFTSSAFRSLKRLDPQHRKIILSYIRTTLDGCLNPRTIVGGRSLKGTENGWRWRVGSYRILGRIQDDVVEIELFRIGHRRDVYENLP